MDLLVGESSTRVLYQYICGSSALIWTFITPANKRVNVAMSPTENNVCLQCVEICQRWERVISDSGLTHARGSVSQPFILIKHRQALSRVTLNKCGRVGTEGVFIPHMIANLNECSFW